MVSDLYSARKGLVEGPSESGLGMENIRDDRSSAPPGDTPRVPMLDMIEPAASSGECSIDSRAIQRLELVQIIAM